ncbi:MFS transporter [Clostridium algidicarnis]|uniref:MFS transporter n=1 Tax=Clostridium algidicarnis TaxID=37659 RepID=UPI001C0CF5F5|nr:MFS transporter [Clostridium algidicarnis]MBU3196565.1 MFS transporter [Clostridium algidicarnis]
MVQKQFKNSGDKFNKNAVLYLGGISFFYICMGSFNMMQGIYIKELNFDESFLGLILSLKTFSLAIFSIPCAMIVNKIGKKKGILLTMIIVPITIILQGMSQTKGIILGLSILQGGANSFILVSEGPFFMENSNGRNRIKLFSYSFADNVFSTMFGYFIFGQISGGFIRLFGSIEALRYAIVISGALGLISIILIAFIKDSETCPVEDKTMFLKDLVKISKKKYPMKFLLYNLLIGFGAGLVVPYFNVYLKYKVNATTEQIGIIMAVAQAAMGLGGLATPYMAARYGRIKTIIMCQVASIPFLMLIALPPNIIVVSIALFIRNGLMNMAGPVVGNLSMDIIEENERSIFASVNNISNNLSRALSAIVGGFIMNNFSHGYELPYFLTAITYIMATMYFYKSFRGFDNKKVYTKKTNKAAIV